MLSADGKGVVFQMLFKRAGSKAQTAPVVIPVEASLAGAPRLRRDCASLGLACSSDNIGRA